MILHLGKWWKRLLCKTTTPLQAQLDALSLKKNSAADKSSTALHCDYLRRWKPLSRWKKQVILNSEPPISFAVGAEQTDLTHCPAHSWAPPAAQGVQQASTGQSATKTVQGSASRTARQLFCSLLKISSEKQTGFVPFHPVHAHKKNKHTVQGAAEI